MLMGGLLWAGAVLLRSAGLANKTTFLSAVTGVLPNICAVWVVLGVAIIFFPYVRHAELPQQTIFPLLGAALLLLVLSEFVHAWWLGAAFDLWDLAASAGAAVVVALLVLVLAEKKEAVAAESAKK